MSNVTPISLDAHYKKVWLKEYSKHIDDEQSALEHLEYFLVDASCDNLNISDELLTKEAERAAKAILISNEIHKTCKQHAHKYMNSAAIMRFMKISTIKTEGYKSALVTSMLCNIVEHNESDDKRALALKAISSDNKEDLDVINRLLTLQLESATQLVDSF